MNENPNYGIEKEVQRMITEILSIRKMWQQRLAEAEQQIKMLDHKLTAYQRTLKDYWESIDKSETKEDKENQ